VNLKERDEHYTKLMNLLDKDFWKNIQK
jgi:hypothetical protein